MTREEKEWEEERQREREWEALDAAEGKRAEEEHQRNMDARLLDILSTMAPYLYQEGTICPEPLTGVELKKRLAAIDKALRAAKVPRFVWNEPRD